jgi:transposase
MVGPLPQSKRDAIKARLEEGRPHLEIAEEINVSIQTVKDYSSNLRMFGEVLLPSVGRRGRKPILTHEMVEVRISIARSAYAMLTCGLLIL